MKILVLGDLHAGEKDGSELIMNHQLSVLDEVIDICVVKNISHIFLTGDVFDIRKSTNTNVLYNWKSKFFDRLQALNINVVTIVGNHDMFYKNTTTPNAIDEHLGMYPNIKVINTPTVLGGVLFVPWICKDNEEECLNAIKNSSEEVCLLHPEIVGAKMDGAVCSEGLALSTFNKFKTVIAGHFHTRGVYDNVTYVGTPYEMSWGDYGVRKGYHILDLDTKELEFCELSHNLFYRFSYDETKDMSYILDADLKNKYVKLIIENREDFKLYDKFLNTLHNKGMQDLKIIEPLLALSGDDGIVSFDGELDLKSTVDLVKEYITDLYPEKKEKLTKLILGLHNEARSL